MFFRQNAIMPLMQGLMCYFLLIAPAGILPSKIPRRHPYSSRVYKLKRSKVPTVKIYSIYTRSNLDLPEQGAHGIVGNDDVSSLNARTE